MQYEDVLSLIGQTPLVEIRKLNPYKKVTVLAKLEAVNPGGSIKDRVALAMIEAAEKSGQLNKDRIVIEATSGNTGIGLAMVCAVKGYKLKLLMPESASEERKRIMRAYGAEIVLTPGHLGTDGAIEEAYRLAREEPDKYVLMDQFNNPASIAAHYQTTGKEIWEQTGGKVTHIVACLGTSGTIMGITRKIKELNPGVQCIAIEPYAGHKIQGLKNMQESYPPGIYDKTILDRILHVEDEEAFEMCRRLAREEGLFVGMSSGAALAGALSVARELDAGTVVTIFPDGGERYLSTSLFVPPERRGIKVFDLYKREEIGLRIEDKSGGPNLFTFGPSMDALDEFEPWRRIVFFDVLNRYLRQKGHDSTLVVGLADFDDRTLDAARKAGLSRKRFCQVAKDKIHNLAARLNIHTGTRFVSASKHTDIAIEICQKLLSKGTASEKLRSVYFDVRRDREYGALIHMDLSKIFPGKTVDLESYVKDNPRDFTLFKRASLQDLKEDNVLKTDWGNVRPSWYLQQASAAMAGCERVDVVLAGQIHAFPHVDNLRSIWKNALNMVPQAWMISQSVEFKEQGQDSPAGINRFLDQDLKPLAIRMWLLSASYHKVLVSEADSSRGSVYMWLKNWARVQDVLVKLKFFTWKGKGIRPLVEQAVFDLKKSLQTALEHDLSLHKFWPVLFNMTRVAHKLMDEKELTFDEAEFLEQNLKSMDDVLGILDWQNLPIRPDELSGEIKEILARRSKARKEKNFELADALRDELVRMGYRVVDTAGGEMVFREG